MTFGPNNTQSSYLPPDEDFPQDEVLFREILSLRERLTANILNIKENANYEKKELLTAQQWFSSIVNGFIVTKYGFRKVFDMVSLNGNVPITINKTLSFPHNITGITNPTRIYGTATTSTGKYIPTPYINTMGGQTIEIDIFLTSTNVVLETGPTIDGSGGNTLIQAYIVFEYLKN